MNPKAQETLQPEILPVNLHVTLANLAVVIFNNMISISFFDEFRRPLGALSRKHRKMRVEKRLILFENFRKIEKNVIFKKTS